MSILCSIKPSIYCNKVAFVHDAEQFKKLANSKTVVQSINAVKKGQLYKKKQNYYFLPNAVPKDIKPDTDQTYWIYNRQSSGLKPNGKVFLDIDIHDRNRAVEIYKQVKDLEQVYGVLYVVLSVRGGLHIIVRLIKDLSITETIAWWSCMLGCPIDNVHDLSRACFMTPSDYVLFEDPMFYDTIVEPIDLGISEEEALRLEGLSNQVADGESKLVDSQHHNLEIKASDVVVKGVADIYSEICSGYRRTYDDNRQELLYLIDQLERDRIDITSHEPNWFKLGCVCYSILGALEGREAFHRVSQFYPLYTPGETDRKFDYIARRIYNFGIGTFIKIMCQEIIKYQ